MKNSLDDDNPIEHSYRQTVITELQTVASDLRHLHEVQKLARLRVSKLKPSLERLSNIEGRTTGQWAMRLVDMLEMDVLPDKSIEATLCQSWRFQQALGELVQQAKTENLDVEQDDQEFKDAA